MWFFFYESPDERWSIRLYGLDQRPDDERDVERGDLFVPREKFLFAGYWMVGAFGAGTNTNPHTGTRCRTDKNMALRRITTTLWRGQGGQRRQDLLLLLGRRFGGGIWRLVKRT